MSLSTQELFIVVQYKTKKLIKISKAKCHERRCELCLKGNDCYSTYQSAIERLLTTGRF